MHKVVDFVLLLAYVEPWCFGTGEVALRGNRTRKNGGVFVLNQKSPKVCGFREISPNPFAN